MRTMCKSKIQSAHVTGLCLDYDGSVTLDKRLMAEADILPYEQVHILNLNNESRFITYAIEGEAGSGQVCLNGAAARLAKKGDTVIILAYRQVVEDEATGFLPRLVFVDKDNLITESRRATEAVPF